MTICTALSPFTFPFLIYRILKDLSITMALCELLNKEFMLYGCHLLKGLSPSRDRERLWAQGLDFFILICLVFISVWYIVHLHLVFIYEAGEVTLLVEVCRGRQMRPRELPVRGGKKVTICSCWHISAQETVCTGEQKGERYVPRCGRNNWQQGLLCTRKYTEL